MIARICRTHGLPLNEAEPPACPKGHDCHTWHVAEVRMKTSQSGESSLVGSRILHEGDPRGESLEVWDMPPTERRFCTRCGVKTEVVMRYIDVRANRKFPVCGVCGESMQRKRSKYRNIKTVDGRGKIRHSRRESKRGDDLFMMQRAGEIRNLRYCNDYPKQTFSLEIYGNPEVEALIACVGAFIERFGPLQDATEISDVITILEASKHKITKYTPDFSYVKADGTRVIEDSKGYRTPEYRLKAKLFRAVTGMDILES